MTWITDIDAVLSETARMLAAADVLRDVHAAINAASALRLVASACHLEDLDAIIDDIIASLRSGNWMTDHWLDQLSVIRKDGFAIRAVAE